MRKVLTVAAFAVAMLVAAPAAAGQAATLPDRVAGTGTLGDFGNPTAYLAAAGGSGGTLGAYAITYPDGSYATGQITCLKAIGNIAYVTGRILLSGGPRQSLNNWPRGSYLVIGVQDNGNGSEAQPDRLNFSPGSPTNPGCGPHSTASPDFFIVRGDYKVVDV